MASHDGPQANFATTYPIIVHSPSPLQQSSSSPTARRRYRRRLLVFSSAQPSQSASPNVFIDVSVATTTEREAETAATVIRENEPAHYGIRNERNGHPETTNPPHPLQPTHIGLNGQTDATMELRVGNKYRLGRKIGSGSFGDIYLGTTINTGEEVSHTHTQPMSSNCCWSRVFMCLLCLVLPAQGDRDTHNCIVVGRLRLSV